MSDSLAVGWSIKTAAEWKTPRLETTILSGSQATKLIAIPCQPGPVLNNNASVGVRHGQLSCDMTVTKADLWGKYALAIPN